MITASFRDGMNPKEYARLSNPIDASQIAHLLDRIIEAARN